MQLAWSQHAWPQLEVPTFLAIAQAAGLKHFAYDLGTREGGHSTVIHVPDAQGMQLVAISFASTMAKAADLNVALQIVRYAAERDVKVVNLSVLSVLDEFASLPDALLGNIRHLGDEATVHGMLICLDSASGLGGGSRAIARTLQAVNHPAVRLQFDTGGYVFHNPGSQVEIAFQRLIGWFGSLRLSDFADFNPDPDFPPLGQGAAVDFARVLQLVDATQLDLPIEVFFRPLVKSPAPPEQIERWLQESLRTLKDCGWRW